MNDCPQILPATRPLPHEQRALFPAWIADKKREARVIDPDAELALGMDKLAIVAAEQAAEGMSEMLRFAREGVGHHSYCFEPDTIEKFAEALRTMVTIELVHFDRAKDPVGAEMLNQLSGAVDRFLEGWA